MGGDNGISENHGVSVHPLRAGAWDWQMGYDQVNDTETVSIKLIHSPP